MIPYIEIIDKYTLKKITQVEPKECWFELSFFEIGKCEVYCSATPKNLAALKKGRYLKMPNKRFIWVITSIQYTYTAAGAKMISAKGYEAKYLLHKRIIRTPKELDGTITSAVYDLVYYNLCAGAGAKREIEGFTVDNNELLIDISGTQATRGYLDEFINALLKTYNCGSQVIYDNGKLIYKIFNGAVKTQQVKFTQSLDNLLNSSYLTDDEDIATNAFIVSTIEDVDYTNEYDKGATGIDRAEILVNSNLSTKYENAKGEELETTPTSDLYKGWQLEEGKNELSKHIVLEQASGEIDIKHSKYEFDNHFFIGDIVRIQDEHFNFFINSRILKYTLKKNTIYSENADYGG